MHDERCDVGQNIEDEPVQRRCTRADRPDRGKRKEAARYCARALGGQDNPRAARTEVKALVHSGGDGRLDVHEERAERSQYKCSGAVASVNQCACSDRPKVLKCTASS